MSFIKKFMAVYAVFLIGSGLVYAAASADYTVTYKNQQGSTLTLTWHPEKNSAGTLSGMLVGFGAGCKPTSVPVLVSGIFSGNAIAMTVGYPKCDKVVAISGNLRNAKSELQVQWLTAVNAKDASGNQMGMDLYTKVAS